MRRYGLGIPAHAALAAGAAVLALALAAALPAGAAPAKGKTYVMKISLPSLHDPLQEVADLWGAAVEKDSGGRIKAQVYPASQLGSIPRQIEGTQFGSIQALVVPPAFMVGVDQRFGVLAAPGLIDSMQQGQRLASDPAVLKLMLGLGAHKGLKGVGLFMSTPSSVISRTPIRNLAGFKGKKLRIFASKFQSEAIERLGATPVAMSLGDVLPALQQGTIDGAVASFNIFVPFHYVDAAKYVTETNQPAVFNVMEVSRKWFDSLPKDLQQIVQRDGAAASVTIKPRANKFVAEMSKKWVAQGGKLIRLPPQEQARMMKILSSVGEDVSKNNPALHKAYRTVVAAAKRARQVSSR